MGKGTCLGHLLECAGQITGGYYADPGFKDIPHLERLGFPIAEIDENGDAVITKVAGSGGRVCVDTCKEQMLYEIHRPDSYSQATLF
ncbi:acyclic terpene utilization AtuA family protein [Symbiopectobacterium purcellii]|uniref:acyclic terpene utilization AtuA family protein n=1 Tax=Symbiopectobacterium purcellii TaxID=2871826 RepID=UPI003F84964E